MSRKPIIAGNWKMHNTIRESIDLASGLKRELYDVDDVEIVVCPVATAIASIADTLAESNIGVGAQNCYWEEKGAFTGEVAPSMIKEAGAKYVILGHSERRALFGETDQTINKKIKAVLNEGLTPIVCVGEVLDEREAGKTLTVVETQVKGCFDGYSADEIAKCVIAYEPVWAIGTGKTATPEQAQEVHQAIRKIIESISNGEVAQGIRIQYGGSVKPDNIATLMSQPDVDGALVGGASLKVDSFAKIVKYKTVAV